MELTEIWMNAEESKKIFHNFSGSEVLYRAFDDCV